MQRRAIPTPGGGTGQPLSSSPPSTFSSSARRGIASINNKRKGFGRNSSGAGGLLNPVVLLIVLAISLLVMSWIFFPAEVMEVEHQMILGGQKLANAAKGTERKAERSVEDWWENAEEKCKDHDDPPSCVMELQSSTWVDGEKKLKKKLQVLYERQLKGEMLGVPVLTRWLGEDVPAWLEPGMDEEEWKRTVDRKYAEMAAEEEQWKKDMAKIVEDRERDLGIVTI